MLHLIRKKHKQYRLSHNRARTGRSDNIETGKTIKLSPKRDEWRERVHKKWWLNFSFLMQASTLNPATFVPPTCLFESEDTSKGDLEMSSAISCNVQKIPQPRSSLIHSGWDLHRGLTSTGPEGVVSCHPPCYWHMSFQVLYIPCFIWPVYSCWKNPHHQPSYCLGREPLNWGKRICHIQSLHLPAHIKWWDDTNTLKASVTVTDRDTQKNVAATKWRSGQMKRKKIFIYSI